MTFPRAPETEEEREAVISTSDWCAVTNQGGMGEVFCTRAPGHTGNHVAGGMTQIFAVWDSK